MKTLVVNYSRSGNTRRIADEIAKGLRADREDLFEVTDRRRGAHGWLRSSADAALRNTPALRPLEHDPSNYDLLVIGTPVWWASISAPIRTFLLTKRSLPRNVAFFCTAKGRGVERVFKLMARLSGRDPIATLVVYDSELPEEEYSTRLGQFVFELSKLRVRMRHNGPSQHVRV